MKQTDIADLVASISNRDWLFYKKELGYDVTQPDPLCLLMIVADQTYKKESGKHDMNRFLDMNLLSLQAYLGLEVPEASSDEPVSE